MPSPPRERLGHLIDPTGNTIDPAAWTRDTWLWIIRRALGLPVRTPTWLTLPAVGQVPVSSPAMWRSLSGLNRDKSYGDTIKPFNFVLAAHVRPFGHPSGIDPERFQLVAPFEKDPANWLSLPWIDRDSGKRYEVTTHGATGGIGVPRVKSHGDVVAEYRAHKEDKSLGPDGNLSRADTRGVLRRRPVTVDRVHPIGKEANELDGRDAGISHDLGEIIATFVDPRSDEWQKLMRGIPTAKLMRATRRNRSTVKRWKAGNSAPRRDRRIRLLLQVKSLPSR